MSITGKSRICWMTAPLVPLLSMAPLQCVRGAARPSETGRRRRQFLPADPSPSAMIDDMLAHATPRRSCPILAVLRRTPVIILRPVAATRMRSGKGRNIPRSSLSRRHIMKLLIQLCFMTGRVPHRWTVQVDRPSHGSWVKMSRPCDSPARDMIPPGRS